MKYQHIRIIYCRNGDSYTSQIYNLQHSLLNLELEKLVLLFFVLFLKTTNCLIVYSSPSPLLLIYCTQIVC